MFACNEHAILIGHAQLLLIILNRIHTAYDELTTWSAFQHDGNHNQFRPHTVYRVGYIWHF